MSQTAAKERSALDEFANLKMAPESGQLPAAMQPHTLAILSRSEIDAQMASAGTRPRDLRHFLDDVRMIALRSEEAAADCHYALPARKEDGDPIEGPSVRFAEILAYAWGNCRVGARVIEEAMDHVTAQGIFNDVEKNNVETFEVRRRITDRRGRRYSLDMINVTANAACSIARRNAILQAIPKPLWFDLYQEARRMAAGSDAELGPRRDKAIGAFKDLGVSEQRIFAMLGVERADQIGLDKLGRLRGIYTAVKDGAVSIREIGPADSKEETVAGTISALDSFAASGVASPSPAASDAAADQESAASLTVAAGDNIPGGGGGGASRPPIGAADRNADELAKALAAATGKDADELIAKALGVATDEALDLQDRLGILDGMRESWTDELPGAFIDSVLRTAAKVAQGELKAAAAKKYLKSLKD